MDKKNKIDAPLVVDSNNSIKQTESENGERKVATNLCLPPSKLKLMSKLNPKQKQIIQEVSIRRVLDSHILNVQSVLLAKKVSETALQRSILVFLPKHYDEVAFELC